MKIHITVQARTGSTRFPNKILQELKDGQSVIEYMINRLKLFAVATSIDTKIVILTTSNPNDEIICNMAERFGVEYYRGDEENVFNRMLQYINENTKGEDIIVDLTSDCPFIPFNVYFLIISSLIRNIFDYSSNVATRTYPDGFDIQAYRAWAYKSIESSLSPTKEDTEDFMEGWVYTQHTGWNLLNLSGNLEIRVGNFGAGKRFYYPELGLTLDNKEDLEVLREVANGLDTMNYGLPEIMDFVLKNKHIFEKNKNIKRKLPGEQ